MLKRNSQRLKRLSNSRHVATTHSHPSFSVILGVYRAFNGQYVYLNAHIIISWKTKMFPWRVRLSCAARLTTRDSLANAATILINSAICRTKI